MQIFGKETLLVKTRPKCVFVISLHVCLFKIIQMIAGDHLALVYVHYVMLRTLILLITVFTTVLGYYLKGGACGLSSLALMLMFILCCWLVG